MIMCDDDWDIDHRISLEGQTLKKLKNKWDNTIIGKIKTLIRTQKQCDSAYFSDRLSHSKQKMKMYAKKINCTAFVLTMFLKVSKEIVIKYFDV